MARILIIDDEELVRWALAMALEHAGHVTIEAENGIDGVMRLVEEGADLAIVDLIMPVRDGYQAIEDISRDCPRVPIIAITGGGPSGVSSPLKRAVAVGADFAISKPIAMDVLLETVMSALDTHRTVDG